jgi:hypothetical protein
MAAGLPLLMAELRTRLECGELAGRPPTALSPGYPALDPESVARLVLADFDHLAASPREHPVSLTHWLALAEVARRLKLGLDTRQRDHSAQAKS